MLARPELGRVVRVRWLEPCVVRVQCGDERCTEQNAFDEVLPGGYARLSLVKCVLRGRRLRVVRAPRVPDTEILQHGRAVPEPVDVAHVRRVLVPEDELVTLAEAADTVEELSRGHGAAASRRPL